MATMMTADDPRHGSSAGAQAHWAAGETPCGPCLAGKAREQKRLAWEHHNGVQMLYAAAEVRTVLEPWLAMGLGPGAVTHAAGMTDQRGAYFLRVVAADGVVRRGTYAALAAVTEDDLAPRSRVHSDLTRTRIYSLMAAGHPLDSIPVPKTGRWRHRDHVTVTTARAVRDHYRRHQHHTVADQSPVVQCRIARAVAAGGMVPAAWDDPDTLAWPLGWTQPVPTTVHGYDEAVVLRVMGGDATVPAGPAERTEIVARWRAARRPLSHLTALTGWRVESYYTPDRRLNEEDVA